jgi:alginate O-acetyltransferase complex protein AlgJ
VLEEHGVEVLDVLPTFLQQRNHQVLDKAAGNMPRQETVFRHRDTHWTTFGASLVAKELAQRIRTYPWYADAARSQGQVALNTTQQWVERRGNLGKDLEEDGVLEADSPKERIRIRKVTMAGVQGVSEDRESPILLMGDSFCWPQHGLPNHLLEELGFPIDRVSIAGGYLSSMLQAIRLRGDGMAGKKIVIWVYGYYSLNRWGQWVPTPLY